jgi:hypothetical protein
MPAPRGTAGVGGLKGHIVQPAVKKAGQDGGARIRPIERSPDHRTESGARRDSFGRMPSGCSERLQQFRAATQEHQTDGRLCDTGHPRRKAGKAVHI